MRQPPFEHCDTCPSLIKKLDCCPLLPIFSSLSEEGISSLAKPDHLFDFSFMLISTIPWIFGAFLLIQALRQRNLRTILPFIIHGLAHVSCDIIKVIYFREQRPDGSCSLKYGLPSCHSIFASLYFTWIILEIYLYPRKRWSLISVIQLLLLSMVPYSRIYLIYHTWKQCLYGWVIGMCYAFVGVNVMRQLELRQLGKTNKLKKSL